MPSDTPSPPATTYLAPPSSRSSSPPPIQQHQVPTTAVAPTPPPKVSFDAHAGRTWDYEYGYSTGIVTISEVRRAPYHGWLRRLGTEERALATCDLRDLHSRDWVSKVGVYDFARVYNDEDAETCGDRGGVAGGFAALHVATCAFSAENQEYETFKLEELRSRTLESSVPAPPFRLVVVEDLTPPVLEILGTSGRLMPRVFQQHVGHSWDLRAESGEVGMGTGTVEELSAMLPSSSMSDSNPRAPTFLIAYPRIVEVMHPTAWRVAEWRSECLRRAARFLQCRNVMPVFDVLKRNVVQCVAYEHITVHFEEVSPGVKKAVVFFPPSVKKWHLGKIKVQMHQPSRLEDNGVGDNPQEPDVRDWFDTLQTDISGTGGLWDPYALLASSWAHSLEFWDIHLVHVSRAIELLAMSSGSYADEKALQAQQQVRAVVTQGISVLSNNIEKIKSALNDVNEESSAYEKSSYEFFDSQAKLEQRSRTIRKLRWLQDHFQVLKGQMERHLPTVEHHINIIIVAQQVRLAETQLEESRKAIQQADTIKRLTILAFVYIPIQTASSLFSMNVSELSPSPSVWIFAVVTVILLLVTITAAAWNKIFPVLYRGYEHGIGSFRLRTIDAFDKIGVNVPIKAPQRYESKPPITEPSWVL